MLGKFPSLKNIPENIRFLAALALADYNDPMPIKFWTEQINFREDYFLAPCRIMTLEKSAPEKALETFAEIPKSSDMKKFYFSTSNAVKHLLEKDDGEKILTATLEKLPDWARDYIRNKIIPK